jgi:adhesin/invasin
VLGQALSAGSAAFNTWAEGWMAGYGRAKVNINPSLDGTVTGSVDFLTPIYDGQSFTFFSQFGLRTMPGERIIGNMGLGNRFFFDGVAIGYNIFLDQDFTRGHMRGGVGLELWQDWLRFSANYYRPLTSWQPSKDFDFRYVQERPAEGWDARLTGYLPFYRHLAVNAAIEQWYGDRVGAFGRSDRLLDDPKVWALGLQWTPVPLLSLSGETRSAGSHTETRLGLSLNYYFGVPLREQLAASNVAELTSLENSRHDFVNRQNEMLLEYRATPGRYIIRVTQGPKPNIFIFTVTDYFGQPLKLTQAHISS